VQIVGATGYGGIGLIEQLLRHPAITVTSLLAKSDTGKLLSDFFPHVRGICDMVVEEVEPQRVGEDADLVVFATPDRVAMQYAPTLLERGIKVIDYAGDFRFSDLDAYNRYAARQPSVGGRPHLCPDLLKQSVYGVPELFREEIRGADLVGNPGCFAITMELALAPALQAHLVERQSLIVDGKTGTSGAGKKLSVATHFSEQAENITPYRVAAHQHGVEAAEVLMRYAGSRVGVTFVPHQTPTVRGILCTCYAQLSKTISGKDLYDVYFEGVRS